MRLTILASGHTPARRLALRIMRRLAGIEPDDVVKTSLYRPGFFGRSFIRLLRRVMRGQGAWTFGERELFAAYTSYLNACPYCAGIHAGTASLGLGLAVSPERLQHWQDTEGLSARAAAMMRLIESLARYPESSSETLDEARRAGLSDVDMTEALRVCFLFDLVNRLANSFGFDVLDESRRKQTAAVLERIGYRLPGFLLRG